jgi:hypothetical protein
LFLGATNKSTVKNTNKATRLQDDRENLFSRIEESRKMLEDELGMDLFIKVYRHVQVYIIAIQCMLYYMHELLKTC